MDRAPLCPTLSGVSFLEISKILGHQWKAMSDEEKGPHELQAKQTQLERITACDGERIWGVPRTRTG